MASCFSAWNRALLGGNSGRKRAKTTNFLYLRSPYSPVCMCLSFSLLIICRRTKRYVTSQVVLKANLVGYSAHASAMRKFKAFSAQTLRTGFTVKWETFCVQHSLEKWQIFAYWYNLGSGGRAISARTVDDCFKLINFCSSLQNWPWQVQGREAFSCTLVPKWLIWSSEEVQRQWLDRGHS